MVYIAGAGVAYPDVELTDEFLAEQGLALHQPERIVLDKFGISSRRVSLPLDYIRNTKNENILDAPAVATATPTTLGAQAAKQAMERAGITPDQVGLIIADTATPYQTCPSEAQRIAGSFGLKVAAYDMVGGSGAFPLYIETISNWKPERLPDFILCISTNTPSQHVRYNGSGLSAHVFGDAASAFVFSVRRPGKLKVVDSYLRKHGFHRNVVIIDRQLSLNPAELMPEKELFQMMSQGMKRLSEKHEVRAGDAIFIGPQLFCGLMSGFSRELGFKPEHVVSNASKYGYSLGASCGAALAEAWDVIGPDQQIVVMHAGDGMWSGSIVLGGE